MTAETATRPSLRERRSFTQTPRDHFRFSGYAVASSVIGVAAATTAASSWVYYIALRVTDFPGLIIACFSAVAAVVGIAFGLIALKEVGAAAYASRPLVRCGIIAGLLAVVMAVAWIILFFSGAGVTALEPEQEELLRPPQQVAGSFDAPGRVYEHV